MALSIRSPEVETLVRELAQQSGLNMTQEILLALEARKVQRDNETQRRLGRVESIVAEFGRLPVLDPRTLEEIVGYNEDGVF